MMYFYYYDILFMNFSFLYPTEMCLSHFSRNDVYNSISYIYSPIKKGYD